MSIEQDKINQLQSELEQARNERNVAQSELAVCCEDRDALALERDAFKVEYESRAIWIAEMNRIIGYDNQDGLHSTPTPHDIAMRLVVQRDELAAHVKADAGRILQLEACCAAMRNRLEELLEVHEFIDDDEMHQTRLTQAALADTCGQGWVSPEAHAALLARMKNLEQLNLDACDDDTKIRDLCRPLLGEKLADHDGYAVVMIVDVVKNTIAQLREHARHALRLARDCHGGSEEFNALESRINK